MNTWYTSGHNNDTSIISLLSEAGDGLSRYKICTNIIGWRGKNRVYYVHATIMYTYKSSKKKKKKKNQIKIIIISRNYSLKLLSDSLSSEAKKKCTYIYIYENIQCKVVWLNSRFNLLAILSTFYEMYQWLGHF